ncbi:MAG TPA: hypothetical protein VFF32_11885 [Dermatophilaceae bacterium]|nr:hypothetical protein [Dermatophilaceae bacterium]
MVTAAVVAADPGVAGETVRLVVEHVGGGRAKRRRLAAAVIDDPSVLRAGRSPAPRVVGDLLLGLRAAGATGISPPRCAGCDREITSLQRRGDHWYCSPCFVHPQVCAACGHERQVAFRDRHGRPRCGQCPDHDTRDPVAVLVEIVTSIDPDLTAEAAATAITAITTKAAHLHKLVWVLDETPGLLTGEGAHAPFPMVLRLIDSLCEAGATVIRRPACPRCGRVVTLSKQADGLRICRNCYARAHAVTCSRCGAVREPAARDTQGRALCPFCLINDPTNREECVRCGRRRRVGQRSADGPICPTCVPKQTSTCSICERTRPCKISKITGRPWCANCSHSWATCSGCGTLAPVRTGTRTAPLCANCTQTSTAWKTCPSCGDTGRLLASICGRCRLRRRADQLLGDTDGHVRPELQALHQALVGVDRPATALSWLSRSTAISVLGELAAGTRPLTHAALDQLPPSKTMSHLRAVLVATQALPARDEHLTQLEAWTTHTVAARGDPDDKQVLHHYAVWHVLRRVRQRTRDAHTTANQAAFARGHIHAAAGFLDWLTARQLSLATCTQLDLDGWMAAATSGQRGRTGPFIRWAKKQKLTRLDFPATAWTGPTGVLDTEGRWEQARRLLHDDTLASEHRLAGLLVLLYAQQPATISRLTIDDIDVNSDHVALRLGREPVVVPEPLADLARQLVANRQGHAKIGEHGSSPWLFPGGRPGHPISSYRLTERLRQIGLQPSQDRSTALFQLASELPAALLARLLGIHISVAVKWQRASSGDWTSYAAEVSRRDDRKAPAPATPGQA